MIINALLLITLLAAAINPALTASAVRFGNISAGKLFKFPAVITSSICCSNPSSTVPSVPVAAAPVVTCTDALPVVGVVLATPVASVTAAVATLCASGSCATAAS